MERERKPLGEKAMAMELFFVDRLFFVWETEARVSGGLLPPPRQIWGYIVWGIPLRTATKEGE